MAMSKAPPFPATHPYLFVGAPGTGKSTAARVFLNSLLATHPTAVAIVSDPNGDTAANGGGFVGTVFPSVAAYSGAAAIPRVAIFRLPEPAELALLAIEIGKRRPCILVVDEFDQCITPGGRYVDDGKVRGALYWIANRGRHLSVGIIGTCRRAALVGTTMPSNARAIFLHRLSGHTDIAWCKAVTDDETATAVAALPCFEGILWDKFGGKHPYRVQPGKIAFR